MGRPLRPVSRIPWKLYGTGKNIEVAHTFQLSTPTGISSFFPVFSPMSTAGVVGERARERYYNHCKLPKESSVCSSDRKHFNSLVSRILPRGTISSPTRRTFYCLPDTRRYLESLQFFSFSENSPLSSRVEIPVLRCNGMFDVTDGVCRLSSVISTFVSGTSFDPLRIRQQLGTLIFGNFVKLRNFESKRFHSSFSTNKLSILLDHHFLFAQVFSK